jgi:hypothetical protein
MILPHCLRSLLPRFSEVNPVRWRFLLVPQSHHVLPLLPALVPRKPSRLTPPAQHQHAALMLPDADDALLAAPNGAPRLRSQKPTWLIFCLTGRHGGAVIRIRVRSRIRVRTLSRCLGRADSNPSSATGGVCDGAGEIA